MDRSDAKCATGTVPQGPPDWDAIKWRTVFRSVHRLQSRIAKAMQEGRRGKVHALQRILTRSQGAACLAVRRVTTNKGKRTPGMPIGISNGHSADLPMYPSVGKLRIVGLSRLAGVGLAARRCRLTDWRAVS